MSQIQTVPYVVPPEMATSVPALREAGIDVAVGLNPVPPPMRITDAARTFWLHLPRLPLAANDPVKLAAMRALTDAHEAVQYDALAGEFQFADRVLGGVATLWTTPSAVIHTTKVLFYIHGGGYVMGSPRTQLALQAALSRDLGVRLISVDYRLAPEHPYPAALNDCGAAYLGLLEDFEPSDVAIFGTSAGGGLAIALLLWLRDQGLPLPAAGAALSAAADMLGEGDSYQTVAAFDPVIIVEDLMDALKCYAGGADPRDPLVSPVHGSYRGIPPLFLIAATREVLASDTFRVAERAVADGVGVTMVISDGTSHVPVVPGLEIPELQRNYEMLTSFFSDHLCLTASGRSTHGDA